MAKGKRRSRHETKAERTARLQEEARAAASGLPAAHPDAPDVTVAALLSRVGRGATQRRS